MATPGRPRRPPKSANTLLRGKGPPSSHSHCASSAATLYHGLLMPASATGSASRAKPKRAFVAVPLTLAARRERCASMEGRGDRDGRWTGERVCGGRRGRSMRCHLRGAFRVPGASGKVRTARTKVWPFCGGRCRPRVSHPGGDPLSPLDS